MHFPTKKMGVIFCVAKKDKPSHLFERLPNLQYPTDLRRTSKLRLKLEENSKSFSCNAASPVPSQPPPFDFRSHGIRRPPNKDQSLAPHLVGTLRCISRNCAIADTSDNLRADYLEKCWRSPPNTENWRVIQASTFQSSIFRLWMESNILFWKKTNMCCRGSQTSWTPWTGHPSGQPSNFARLIAPLQNYPNKYAHSLFSSQHLQFLSFLSNFD